MLHIKEEYTENPNKKVEELMDDFAKYLDNKDIQVDYVDYTSKTILTLTRLFPPTLIIVAEETTPSAFKVVWNEIENAIGYEVHLYTGDTLISSVTINSTSLTYTGLVHETTYKVGAISNADGIDFANSLESELVSVTLLPLWRLDPPRNIVLTARTQTSLTFIFDAPASTEGLTGYTVECNNVSYEVNKDNRIVNITGLIEDVEYTVYFKSNGDKLNYDDSRKESVTATPMRDAFRYYNAYTNSDLWVDDKYTYNILTKSNNTPGNAYTTVLTG